MNETLQPIAERINNGTELSDSSRALIVFNLTASPLAGVAIFHTDMSWPMGTPLPPISVMEMDGTLVASAMTAMAEGPDRKRRADHCQLTFDLHFAVAYVPAQGWKTYIAAYTPEPSPMLRKELTETPGLLVIETLRHVGDLPAVGTFADWCPSMVQ